MNDCLATIGTKCETRNNQTILNSRSKEKKNGNFH